MTTVYPGAHTDRIETLERLVAEQDRRIRDLEYALLTAAGSELDGANATLEYVRGYADGHKDKQGTAAAAPTVHPLPVATSSEPLMAEERYSASLGTFVCARCLTESAPHQGCKCGQNAGEVFFRPGDRCAVYTGGDPCVKPGTVEVQEHDGRWLISIDRSGKIRATEEEMVFLPESWR